jgi:phage repressor protein C with HTH and peptisase S24 domain
MNVNHVLPLRGNNGYMQKARIHDLRLANNLTQQQVADYCGVSRVAVSKWESGNTKDLRMAHLFKLAKLFRVSAEEIALGTAVLSAKESVAPYQIPERNPAPDYLPIAHVLLKLEAGVTGYEVQQIEGNGRPIFMPREKLDKKGWRADRLFALTVTGDSMEPALYAGDLVVINADDTQPADGAVFAVNYEGQSIIKRLRRDAGNWWLDSDNARHKPKLCDEHAIIIGRVIHKQSEII